MRTKIAFLTPLYEPSVGGVQATLRLFTSYLAKEGCKVRVYTSQLRSLDELKFGRWQAYQGLPAEETKRGVTIRRYPVGGLLDLLLGVCYVLNFHLRLPFSEGLLNAFFARSFRHDAWRKDVRDFKPQILFVAPCTESLMKVAARIKKETGARLVVKTSLHLASEPDARLRRILSTLREADALLVNTSYEKETLTPYVRDPEAIHVTSIGLDVEDLTRAYSVEAVDAELRRKLEGRSYALYLGRKQQGKGIASLVTALETARAEFPDLHGVVAGEETEYFQQEVAKKIQGKSYWINTGHVDGATKRWLYKNARVFSMVSSVESFGMVYCESWLEEVPVIAADTPQMRCIVEDGVNGFLVPFNDEQALGEAIRKVLADPAMGRRMGQNGRQKVLSEFGGQAVEKRLLTLIKRLAGASS